jgi:hypothetical protein
MEHRFNVELAMIYGVEEAVLIDKLVGWIHYNKANGKHYHDGRTWTFNSAKALAELFPYMTESKIKRVIARLVDSDIVVKGNYNENQYDRTTWYSFTDAGNSLVQKYYFHSSKMTNGKIQNGLTIPNNQPIYQHNSISFTPSGEDTDGRLFDADETSTMTMLSSEENIPYAAQAEVADMDGCFEDLWLMYERKGSKAKARKEFEKLAPSDIATMRLHIPAYLESRPERQYRLDFERYIKNKAFTSVVYSKSNVMLFDPEASDTSATTEILPEHNEENTTITINGVKYR